MLPATQPAYSPASSARLNVASSTATTSAFSLSFSFSSHSYLVFLQLCHHFTFCWTSCYGSFFGDSLITLAFCKSHIRVVFDFGRIAQTNTSALASWCPWDTCISNYYSRESFSGLSFLNGLCHSWRAPSQSVNWSCLVLVFVLFLSLLGRSLYSNFFHFPRTTLFCNLQNTRHQQVPFQPNHKHTSGPFALDLDCYRLVSQPQASWCNDRVSTWD